MQSKRNITKELADNKGYVRLLFKVADTQEPSYTGCISSASLNGKTVGGLGPSRVCDAPQPGSRLFCAELDAPCSPTSAVSSPGSHSTASSPMKNGCRCRRTMTMANGLVIDDNARIARMSGQFNVQFYGAGATDGACA